MPRRSMARRTCAMPAIYHPATSSRSASRTATSTTFTACPPKQAHFARARARSGLLPGTWLVESLFDLPEHGAGETAVHPSIKLVCIAFASTVLAAATGPIPAGEIYKVPLSGQAETNFAHPSGGTGDPDGLGAVTIAIYPTKRQVC